MGKGKEEEGTELGYVTRGSGLQIYKLQLGLKTPIGAPPGHRALWGGQPPWATRRGANRWTDLWGWAAAEPRTISAQ